MSRPLGIIIGLFVLVASAIVGARFVGVEQAAIATAFSAAALSVSSCIAYLLYQFQRQQAEDSWLETFRELHAEFWNDPDMAKVRNWIACDEAYQELEPVLRKRAGGQVAASEYEKLEKVDKFCAFMIRIVRISAKTMTKEHKQMWNEVFYRYWLHSYHGRLLLADYIRHYWRTLGPYLEKEYN